MKSYLRDGYVKNGLWLSIFMALLIFGPALDGKPTLLGPHVVSLLWVALCFSGVMIVIGIFRVHRGEASN